MMTWNQIREIAIGQMGMSNQDFLDSDWEKEEKPKTRQLTKEQIEWRKRMDAIMRKNHGQA